MVRQVVGGTVVSDDVGGCVVDEVVGGFVVGVVVVVTGGLGVVVLVGRGVTRVGFGPGVSVVVEVVSDVVSVGTVVDDPVVGGRVLVGRAGLVDEVTPTCTGCSGSLAEPCPAATAATVANTVATTTPATASAAIDAFRERSIAEEPNLPGKSGVTAR